MKKPVLNLTLTLTLGLPAKYSDVFHCLYNKGKFLMSSRWARVGASVPKPLACLELTKYLPLYN